MSDRATNEAGFTLIEALITMVVLAVGGLAVVGAITSSVLVADAHRGMADGEVVARDYVEAVRAHAASLDPWQCPTASELEPGFARDGWTPAITKVRYWLPGAPVASDSWTEARGSCTAYYDSLCGTGGTDPDLAACDPGVVRVDLQVENARDDVAATTIRTSAVVRRSDIP